ncbi:MAG: zinc ABC transporter solute-binding protein [Rhodospirillaceae bacterium]|jgi:zinc transport system substrate-binding protein|nr:zinc ABC transporter solute-binding protein [Rhodospirillaceae bacterium]MBT5244372.1 zinc ABC transporter solute-binding protein [Rhodospirillaceae bacterium]MBT5563733.1 zinc ABC transporter solute-binding protein [Rhodospirillaceae bacterium]MBT6241563.1 zinc ABC transporter solute-binding protein [Rhodospirillaceae bacterium]
MRHTKTILFALICLLLTSPAEAGLSVAVSIKPVHSLVAAVMDGVGEPSLIVKGSRSPHSYSLKPSDARALSRADVVIWMGPDMELFLQKPIGALSSRSKVITLIEVKSGDPHLWLSPKLAISMVSKIALALIKTDPANTDSYKSNANALTDRLRALQAYGMGKLSAIAKEPFLVFHDAWSHFARSFGLSIAGAVALSPERPAGAKQVSTIRRLIGESGARCLFREPQFKSPLLSSILEDHKKMRVFELDPLGAAYKPGPTLYFKMMETNIDAVASCLQ